MERFRATLAEAGRGGGRWVEVPFDARERFGHERPPVRGTVDGTPFRLRLFVYDGITYLGLPHEIREAAGIEAGDPVMIELELDHDLREAEVPPVLEDALAADATAREAFDGLASTHRREYAEWIWAAAPDETRERRVKEALGMLRQGVKNP
jgi:bifunctional DNA-binding transcriptional regulator/antitoxin component of YhaV-PrlF toxin-antitoxin module